MDEKMVLRMEHVTMQFGGVVAVNDLSLDVPEGKIVALIGPNGLYSNLNSSCDVLRGFSQVLVHRGDVFVQHVTVFTSSRSIRTLRHDIGIRLISKEVKKTLCIDSAVQ